MKPQGHGVKAAQYLRMSTEHQKYSLQNQADAIAEYANQHGYQLSRTYFDPGRSGLTLKKRKGLQALLADALAPDRGFDAVLVLDVSRWGRFQDPDQSAHYEFLCREAGVHVAYCGEPFDNDGSMASGIFKHIKRMMAAEYIRELSEKVSRAHIQQARLGFRQGGTQAYGIRRLVVDAWGKPRFLLGDGQRKAVTSDRVVMVHGPPEELRIIRRIFHAYVRRGRSISTIMGELNAERIPAVSGREWTPFLVRSVLKSELMIGNYLYNRTDQRMAKPRRKRPRDAWVRVKIMAPIIAESMFRQAADRLTKKGRERVETAVIKQGLKRLLRTHGYLSRQLIEKCPYLPSALTLRRYFGNMHAAYGLIDYRQLAPRWQEPNGSPASDARLLEILRGVHAAQGYVTWLLLDATPGVPSGGVYKKRFGSLTKAYQLAGLPCSRHAAHRAGYVRAKESGTAPVPASERGLNRSGVTSRFTDDDLLSMLRRLNARDGYVSVSSIQAEPSVPTSSTFQRRFGSMLEAYAKAGLCSDRREIWLAGNARQRTRRTAN